MSSLYRGQEVLQKKSILFYLRGEGEFGPILKKTAKGGVERDRARATHGAKDGGLVIASLGEQGMSPNVLWSLWLRSCGINAVLTAYSGERQK